MYQMNALWHPCNPVVHPHSCAPIFQPTLKRGEVKSRVLRSVILGTMVGVQLDHIAVIVMYVLSVGSAPTKLCTAQPAPLLANLRKVEIQRNK